MYFVDQNDEIITRVKYEYSCVTKSNSQQNWNIPKYAKVNQDQKYVASYQRWTEVILFWKNKKKIMRIKLRQEIGSLILDSQFMAVLLGENLYIYYNKNKLISKTQNIRFIRQLKFNIHKQIIFKEFDTVEIYDFTRKSLTICDRCYFDNLYEYCPINDIILIPKGDKQTEYLSVWGVKQSQIINEVFTGSLKECRIKMSKSGNYFIVSQHRSAVLDIYSYGDQITLIRKINNVKPQQEIEWVLDDNYLLIHSFIQYQIIQVDNGQILDCKILSLDGVTNHPTKYIQPNDVQKKKQIYILIIIQDQKAHYYSINL